MKQSLLYFLPGVSASDLIGLRMNAFAAEVLSDISDPREVAVAELKVGPSGSSGTLFAVAGQSGEAVDGFGFHVESQTWKETSGGSVWVGWPDEFQVGPKDLERRWCPASDLQLVSFADGSHWEIPILRDPLVQVGGRDVIELDAAKHSTSLKTTHYRNESGKWVFDVDQRYSELFDQSRDWWQWILEAFEAGKDQFDFPEVFDYAVEVIGLRYRYTQALHDATRGRLLDTDVVSQVVMVSCGWSVAKQLIQKKS